MKKDIKLPIIYIYELNKILDLSNAQFYGDDHSRFRWKKIVSSSTILGNLKKNNLIYENKDSFDLDILKRGPSGRVTKMLIKPKNSYKQIVLVKDDIRKVLSFLPSNLFTIN